MPTSQHDDFEPDDLSNVLACIYDAGLDRSLWSPALSRISHFVGGTSAALSHRNLRHGGGEIRCASGIAPRYAQILFDRHIKPIPGAGHKPMDDSEYLLSTSLPLPRTDFVKTAFHDEPMRPIGLSDLIICHKSENDLSMLIVFRDERDEEFNNEARRRAELVISHIHRAASFQKQIDSRSARVSILAQMTDLLDMGIYVTNASGHILHSNATGSALIAAGHTLYSVGGRLALRNAQSEKAMRKFFADLHKVDGDRIPTRLSLSIAGGDGHLYVSHLLPLKSTFDHLTGDDATPTTALFIRRANLEMSLNLDVLSKAFRLTPTEVRVLTSIVDIGGTPEAAAALGVATTTVKTHLGRLFEKTGATRQAELVKLVASYTMQLIG